MPPISSDPAAAATAASTAPVTASPGETAEDRQIALLDAEFRQSYDDSGEADSDALTATPDEQDDNAFQRTLTLLDQGQTPDPETLAQATRHANRLQQQFGIGLERRTDSRT